MVWYPGGKKCNRKMKTAVWIWFRMFIDSNKMCNTVNASYEYSKSNILLDYIVCVLDTSSWHEYTISVVNCILDNGLSHFLILFQFARTKPLQNLRKRCVRYTDKRVIKNIKYPSLSLSLSLSLFADLFLMRVLDQFCDCICCLYSVLKFGYLLFAE